MAFEKPLRHRKVRVNGGYRGVVLPNGVRYDGPTEVLLTDSEYARLSDQAFASGVLSDLGESGELTPEAHASTDHSELPGIGGPSVVVEEVTGTAYAVVQEDDGKVKRFTSADPVVVSLPDGINVGTMVSLLSVGAGGLTVQAGGTATIVGAGTVAQDKEASCLCDAVDHWNVQGAA